MNPQSLYLCGVSEVRVETKVAPFRALTHFSLVGNDDCFPRRNEGCPIQDICKISGINSLGFFSCTKTPKEA